jgi:hypothetical protein
MVRSNELGCRNGWNADLWVPANNHGTEQRAQPLSSISGRAAQEVEPSEQNDLITSIVAAKTDNLNVPENRPSLSTSAKASPVVEEDIIVNQSPSLSWSAPAQSPISSQPASELVQNPKAAILRARDQFRQRRRSEGRLADQFLAEPYSTQLASAREAQQFHDYDLEPPEPEAASIDPRYENRPLLRAQPVVNYQSRRPVAPVSPQEIERPFPSMTDFPEDRARFESVPYLDAEDFEADVFETAQDDTWIETRQVDAVLPEPYVVDDFFEEDDVVVETATEGYEEEELSVRHRESILNRFLRQRRERRTTPDISDIQYFEEDAEEDFALPAVAASPVVSPRHPAIEEPIEARDAYARTDRLTEPEPELAEDPEFFAPIEPVARQNNESFSSRSVTRTDRQPTASLSDRSLSADQDDFFIPPPLPEYQPSEHQQTQSFETRRRLRVEPDRTERQSPVRPTQPIADEFGDQPLFAAQPLPVEDDFEIDARYARTEPPSYSSPRQERICQTCRDFRPAENGERGWCNNKWAFNHRRMVDADDLACRNSLGSWWTPKDESWRRDGDISRHAQQTPRVDQWLLGTRENEADRRRSGS